MTKHRVSMGNLTAYPSVSKKNIGLLQIGASAVSFLRPGGDHPVMSCKVSGNQRG